MNRITNELNIGASSPFRFIHMSDTHLTFADERDGEEKLKLSRGRATVFPNAEEVLAEACSAARELDCPIMHTGDLIDFVSNPNLETAKCFTDEYDVFYAAGNHDFSLYCGEAFEDADYRNRSLDRVQSSFKNNIRMSSRVINGVNFVALDNGYYRFEDEQTDFLKNEAARGLPIVLMIHKPIYDEEMYEFSMKTHHAGALTGLPDKFMEYRDEEWVREMRADEPTKKAVEYIRSEPLIKAVLTGHLHTNYEGKFNSKIPLFLTSGEDIRIITVR